MLCTGSDMVVEPYKSYRNRALKKHLDKIKNQLTQIKNCSLRPEDKAALIKRLIEELNNPF